MAVAASRCTNAAWDALVRMAFPLVLRSLAAGGLVVALIPSAAPGIASADVDSVLAPLITTPCSYAQITAALAAEAPDLAGMLNGRPQAQARLQHFLSLPVDQREQAVNQQLAANPDAEAMIDARLGTPQAREVIQVANTCGRY
jgi:hemophore-related protein